MKRILCLLLALWLLPLTVWAEEDALTARLVYDLLRSGDTGAVYALLDSTMQSALQENDLAALLPALDAAYGAPVRYGEEETTLAAPYRITALPVICQRGGILFQVTWQENRIAGLFYSVLPPDESAPAALPDGLAEEEIEVGEPALPGTLTWPLNASTPLPAVVLVHGSGPNDRDETIGQTKLFRDLAWALAQQGIAVLRYDKRTLVYGNTYTADQLKAFTVQEESITDAIAAARLLAGDPRIDAGRVYLAGHSLGAMIAPRIASENPGLFAGIVLLSGTPKTLGDIVLSQNQAVVDALPAATQWIGKMQLLSLRKEWESLCAASGEQALGMKVFGQNAYYFWEMAQQDTGNLLKDLPIPALIINGGQDFQVTDADGIDAWRALELPGTVQIIHHPALNHLLMAPDASEEVRGTVQEYDTPCHVSDEVIDEIAAFILK